MYEMNEDDMYDAFVEQEMIEAEARAIEVKCGTRTVRLYEGDIVLDNGRCFQLITQKYLSGYKKYPYKISKGKAKQLIKNGYLLLAKREGTNIYYRFKNQVVP